MWAPDSPINRRPAGRGGSGADSGGWDNDLARSFALRAIAAQPLDYAGSVAHDVSLAFRWTPAKHPRRVSGPLTQGRWPVPPPDRPAAAASLRAYDPGVRDVRSVSPYAGFLIGYQKLAYLRGPILAAILLAGAPGRRSRSLLPWSLSVAVLVLPVALLDFGHRYVLPAVPLACVAAALSITHTRWQSRGRGVVDTRGGAYAAGDRGSRADL